MIKAAKYILILTLCKLFNAILKLEYFPAVWSTALMVPIFKSGCLDNPDNYRGISLNSSISKLFTSLMNVRLVNFLELGRRIKYNQIGFRRSFRTSDHVFTLKTLIDKSFNDKEKLYTCFVDFKKAYDTVWRDALFFKMFKENLSSKFINTIRSMYSELSVKVVLPTGLSPSFPSKVGVKQGCNLSPTLFNIFINDLISLCDDTKDADSPLLGTVKISCLLYADDLVLISKSKKGLQNLLNSLNGYCDNWFMKVNLTKTKCVVFGRRKDTTTQFYLGDVPLVTSENYSYLGTIFVWNGSFRQAIQSLQDKATKAMYSLINKIFRFRSCDFKTSCYLFDSLVKPVLCYNCEVWGTSLFPKKSRDAPLFDFHKISTVDNVHLKFLKHNLGLNKYVTNWGTFSETGRKPLNLFVYNQMIRFFWHLRNSDSDILKEALNTNIQISITGFRSWASYILQILKEIQCENFLDESDPSVSKKYLGKIQTKLHFAFIDTWRSHKDVILNNSDSKLGLYMKLVDHTFKTAAHINSIQNYKVRNSLTRFRLSAHNLPIETLRYLNLPRSFRLCPFCCTSVGDEKHFFMDCQNPTITSSRLELFSLPSIEISSYSQDEMITLLRETDPTLLFAIGKYIRAIEYTLNT